VKLLIKYETNKIMKKTLFFLSCMLFMFCSSDETEIDSIAWVPEFTSQIATFNQTSSGSEGTENTRTINVTSSSNTVSSNEQNLNQDINTDGDLLDDVDATVTTYTASENLGAHQITTYTITLDNTATPNLVTFNSNLHNSLPSEWLEQYQIILNNLEVIIPTYTTDYLSEVDVFAWNSNTYRPFSSQIGDASGASLSSSDEGGWNVILEIPEDEFTNNNMHRYSVLPHEFFHVYQLSISADFTDFGVKWLIEGPAALFESLYLQEYYDFDYLTVGQLNSLNEEYLSNPEIFENYDSYMKDSNYSSSVFMTLALIKELMILGNSEETAIRMIFKDFQQRSPSAANWKQIFQEVFSISVDTFYQNFAGYVGDIPSVRPSENLILQSILNN
jgi:hypothetical protein